jgi:hypothetical protein
MPFSVTLLTKDVNVVKLVSPSIRKSNNVVCPERAITTVYSAPATSGAARL